MSILYESYGQSPEKRISAQLRPTLIGLYLFDEAYAKSMEGETVFVGTKITIVTTLHEKTNGATCKNPAYYPESTENQPVDVFHRVDGGAWEKIFTVTISQTSDHGSPSHCGADKYYTLSKAGTHDFYAKYGGNAYLEGCEAVETNRVMSILYEDYAKSPERRVVGAKRPTVLWLFLFDEAWKGYVHDQTLFVGTKIALSIALSELVDSSPTCRDPATWGANISTAGKTVQVYHRVDNGPWEKIRDAVMGTTAESKATPICAANVVYTLAKAGTHDFYAEFGGTDYLEGCEKAARAFAR